MTIEQKAAAIKKYCNGKSCPKCELHNIQRKTCYKGYDQYPEDVERNYEIIFGGKAAMQLHPKCKDKTDEAKEKEHCKTEETKESDPVNHPSHYTAGDIECIDAIGAAICKYENPTDAWLAGQVIKYLWRAPLKGKYNEDLKKAQFYLNRLVKGLEDKTNGQT